MCDSQPDDHNFQGRLRLALNIHPEINVRSDFKLCVVFRCLKYFVISKRNIAAGTNIGDEQFEYY